MHIYCLSLGRAPERRSFMEEAFSKEDIEYLDAVDGLDFALKDKTDQEGHPVWKKASRAKLVEEGVLLEDAPLPPTHVACSLSHIKALEKFLKTKDSWCIVMEDDVEPTEFLKQAWEHGNKLEDVVVFPDGCDMLYICGRSSGAHVFTTADAEGSVKNVHTMMGYAITRRGAEAALSASQPMRWLLDFQFAACCYPKHAFDKGLLPEELKGKPAVKALVFRNGWVKHSDLAEQSYLGHDVNSSLHPASIKRVKNMEMGEFNKAQEVSRVRHRDHQREVSKTRNKYREQQ